MNNNEIFSYFKLPSNHWISRIFDYNRSMLHKAAIYTAVERNETIENIGFLMRTRNRSTVQFFNLIIFGYRNKIMKRVSENIKRKNKITFQINTPENSCIKPEVITVCQKLK